MPLYSIIITITLSSPLSVSSPQITSSPMKTIQVNYDHELINQLNNHYNKNRHIEVSIFSPSFLSLSISLHSQYQIYVSQLRNVSSYEGIYLLLQHSFLRRENFFGSSEIRREKKKSRTGNCR